MTSYRTVVGAPVVLALLFPAYGTRAEVLTFTFRSEWEVALGGRPDFFVDFEGFPAEGSHPVKGDIDELIKQLGSDCFEAREEATRRLLEREEAAPALRRALDSPDAEVVRRASQILDEFARRAGRRARERLVALAQDGEVDQVVERLVHWEHSDEEEACWKAVAELAWKLWDLDRQRAGKARLGVRADTPVPFQDFRRYVMFYRPQVVAGCRLAVAKLGHYLMRGEEVSIESESLLSGVIVSSGRVRVANGGNRDIIFAGDDVEVQDIFASVVVCGGDFTARKGLSGCIVLARGAVRCPDDTAGCLIIAGGAVHIRKNSVVSNTIQENEPTPLGFVKFFDPKQVGVEVEAAKGGVRVKNVADGKPFAKAGLQEGDAVLAVGGDNVTTPDDFRRRLRRATAEGKEVVLQVQRGQKAVEVRVTLGE